MAWRKNPRTVTKEQFSTGTTIDGDRIDNALDDVVERVNDIPYGDLRKRWVPTTYVAGWTPQSPVCISSDTPKPTTTTSASDEGGVFGTHHWPWLRVLNDRTGVVSGTDGDSSGDPTRATNTYRLKGVSVPGIKPFGHADIEGASTYTVSALPVGQQFAWTRSWLIESPSVLDSIDLILEVDDTAYAQKVFQNNFEFSSSTQVPAGYPDVNSRDLVVTAAVDSEFAREDRNMSDVEILRKGFVIESGPFSRLALPLYGSNYQDMEPEFGSVTDKAPGTTIQGAYVKLKDLNVPIHQYARLRVSVVIPSYLSVINTVMRNSGWNPDNVSARYPWMQQKIHMAVTMLEEVTSG